MKDITDKVRSTAAKIGGGVLIALSIVLLLLSLSPLWVVFPVLAVFATGIFGLKAADTPFAKTVFIVGSILLIVFGGVDLMVFALGTIIACAGLQAKNRNLSVMGFALLAIYLFFSAHAVVVLAMTGVVYLAIRNADNKEA